MKKVTVTLDDAVAIRADAEAASRGKSVSEFVRELVEREVGREAGREEGSSLKVMQGFLSQPGIPAPPGAPAPERLPNRQETYDERIDELVRRYEHSNLLDR
jgi:hypothetical protein